MSKDVSREIPNYKEAEDVFWSGISPDIKRVLEVLERQESWVYNTEQFPELFERCSNILPSIAPMSNSSDEYLLDDIIMLLSVMPFRKCVYSLSWLETHSLSEFGWGMMIHAQSLENLSLYTPSDIIYDTSHVIKIRIDALIKLEVSAQVFSAPI
jgi:hypothetical protein